MSGNFIRHCGFCLVEIPAENVLKCGKCKRRAYCGKECQTADWKFESSSDPGSDRPRGQGHRNWCGLQYGEEDLDWKVAPVEGKGLGLIALRMLPANSRVMIDSCQLKDMCHPAMQDLLPLGGSLTDKFALNCISYGSDDEEGEVLCLRMSRANHNCYCNASHHYVESFKTMVLTSNREIAEGEEICYSYTSFNYTNPELKHANPDTGREELRSTWGIECPENCFCRDPTVMANINRARELDSTISVLNPRKEDVNRVVRATKNLMELHKSINSSYFAKDNTLWYGIKAAVTTQATMNDAKDFARQLYALCEPIMHPKIPELLDYKNWKDDISTHYNYMRFE